MTSRRADSPLDEISIRHLRASFDQIRPRIDQFAGIFYRRLFEQSSRIALLFRGDLIEQQERLGKMIVTIVDGLDDLDEITGLLGQLGRRHLDEYGVQPDDFEAFRDALQLAVGEVLGEAMTPPISEAWYRLFAFVTDAMLGRNESRTG